ncbi:MAG: hypothetical protein F8N36_12040 [Desulfovibrio sp.]|uniref:hypothetical protein n=1 Tax=Desulfovibrio sp. TaxID=885 RepID=UPI00135D4A35|nr:hypothetical protein [Desulfovibrio sp.]MTJ93578.1 hypothetical protein [Desulfovibrio sp.]
MTVVKNPRPRSGDQSIGDALLRCRVLPALAFNKHQCSIVWKIDPQDAFIRRHFGWSNKSTCWASVPHVVKAIGYDADPRDRCRAGKSHGKDSPGCVNWYPLIEWEINREACSDIIAAAGLPVPPKSSCVFCPSMQKAEIDELARTEPDNFGLAIAVEDGAVERGLESVKGLGRGFSWRSYASESAPMDVRMVLAYHDHRVGLSPALQHVDDETLLRAIQQHPDLSFVDFLRQERRRRPSGRCGPCDGRIADPDRARPTVSI